MTVLQLAISDISLELRFGNTTQVQEVSPMIRIPQVLVNLMILSVSILLLSNLKNTNLLELVISPELIMLN